MSDVTSFDTEKARNHHISETAMKCLLETWLTQVMQADELLECVWDAVIKKSFRNCEVLGNNSFLLTIRFYNFSTFWLLRLHLGFPNCCVFSKRLKRSSKIIKSKKVQNWWDSRFVPLNISLFFDFSVSSIILMFDTIRLFRVSRLILTKFRNLEYFLSFFLKIIF